MYIFTMKKFLRKNRMFLSMCAIVFLLLCTVRTMYKFSIRDYHVKTNKVLGYSPLERAMQVANYLTNLEMQKLQKEQERIDFKYCGGPCRFINVLYIREQETRAQLHVRHLAFTSAKVNRTLVLPNVSGSHLGACKSHDFEYYYDMEWTRQNKEYFNSIRMKDFVAWIRERKEANVPVSDQVLSTFDLDTHVDPSPVTHCFSGLTKPKSTFNQILKWNITGQTCELSIQAREIAMVQFLKGPSLGNGMNANEDIEVLHMEIYKANQWSQMAQSDIPIPYHPAVIKLADTTAKSLGPFVAIHWRMEASKNTNNMLPCAQHLISLLKRKKKFNFFLLTDYPHMFTQEQQEAAMKGVSSTSELSQWLQSNSDSFLMTDFTRDHHEAIHYLYQHDTFHVLETGMERGGTPPDHWQIMQIPDRLKLADVDRPRMIDSGWLGILDKLIAMRSVHFFAGQKGDVCGRSKSTFTAQIIDARTIMRKSRTNYFGPKNKTL